MHQIKKVPLRVSSPLETTSNNDSSKGELALKGTFLFGAHGPKTFWFNQLQSYPRNEEVTKAFGSLSCTPLLAAVQDNIAEIKLFVNHCYGQTDVLSVNEARFQIFTSSVSGNFRE